MRKEGRKEGGNGNREDEGRKGGGEDGWEGKGGRVYGRVG